VFVTACALVTPGNLEKLRTENKRLDALTQEQQMQITALQWKLHAKDMKLQDLRNRQRLQEKKLHATTHQVVRAESKLRGLACAPCAVSHIAEVETTLNAQISRAEPATSNPLASEARRLLQISTQELENGHYARSMELADQAQQLIDKMQFSVDRSR
jgi:hypothetical protein